MAGWIADFLDLMPSTITLAPWIGRDVFNKPTFGTVKTYRAYVDERPQFMFNAAGQQIIYHAALYLYPYAQTSPNVFEATTLLDTLTAVQTGLPAPKPSTSAILELSRVTLPDGTQPIIARATALDDENGYVTHVLYS